LLGSPGKVYAELTFENTVITLYLLLLAQTYSVGCSSTSSPAVDSRRIIAVLLLNGTLSGIAASALEE
jgi:hypothetical protein